MQEPDNNPPEPHTATVSRTPMTPSSETKPDKAKRGRKDRPEPTTLGGKLWYNWVKPIGSVILVVVVLRSTLIDWNDVPTGSMEPEIQVGDRIAVNRLAYALQAPLTGPQIGIPFTPLQWNNPLDGIPQLQWGRPARGDIVTFWNPVTKVRMVKRIVAEPGDTIEMNGGEMTINGEAATYEELDAATQGLSLQTKYKVPSPMGGTQYAFDDLAYRREALLGETRTIQHIMNRWVDNTQLVLLNNGDRARLINGMIRVVDFSAGRTTAQPLTDYMRTNPTPIVLADIKAGVIYRDGKRASYNELAGVMLADLADGPRAAVLAKAGLGVNGHELLRDGKPVSMDVFQNQLGAKIDTFEQADKPVVRQVLQTMQILGDMTMTCFGPITLGEDAYFMVGDNRNNSHDSRRFGPVDRGEITGQAFAVAFSFEDNKMLTLPPKPAWKRFFKDLD